MNICTTCATGITNGDESVWEDATDAERAAIDSALEELGLVTLVPHEFPGYFDCFVCDQTDLHDGYTTAN